MKRPLLIAALFSLVLSNVNAQDKMKKHSGETLDVKIIRVNEFTINFKYPGEDAEQTIGKLAVADITYSSGRKESISDKIVINSKDDWEKVQIITDKSQILGLKKGAEVRGKTSGLLSYNTAGSADKKATKRIKQDAAEQNAPFVLLVGDKNDGFGVKQAIKDGVVYSYK
jgi:hypothetical protein